MNDFISSALGAGAATSIVGILLGKWLDQRFTLAREKESRAEKRREESRAVAEILSVWVRSSYMGKPTNEDLWKLQSVYWENILGLDGALLDVLCPRLANAPDAASTNEVVVQARRILLGLDKPDITAERLNTWPPQ